MCTPCNELYDSGYLDKKDYALIGNVVTKLRFSKYLPFDKVSEHIFRLREFYNVGYYEATYYYQDKVMFFNYYNERRIVRIFPLEDYKKMDAKVQKAAGQLGIVELLKKYPYEVSGGQKQRTAIARALITNPRILLADEPTGALDSKAATNLLKQLREINQTGQTILMVTHSNVAASYADRVMFIKDGEVFHQIYRGDMTRSALLDKICDAVTVLMRGGEDSES